MALLKEYFILTSKYQSEYGPKTVVLMQVGAFFEVYGLVSKTNGDITGSEIVDFSRVCELNIADKKMTMGTQGVIMAGFSHFMIDKYLRRLKDAGYTAVIYAQDPNDVKTRSLVAISSPGTYFPQDVGGGPISNNTLCIWINVVDVTSSFILKKMGDAARVGPKRMVQVGLANVDIYTGKTSIFEFAESFFMAPTTFDELERFASIYKPSEVVIVGNIPEGEMQTILEYCNIEAPLTHKVSLVREKQTEMMKRAFNSEKQVYQKELLSRLYKVDDYTVFSQNFYDNAIAAQAFCFVLDFVHQHNPSLVSRIKEPTLENCSDRLILANHSLKQLNIIEAEGGSRRRLSSVENLLNLSLTPMGRRRFSNQFLNPTANTARLQKEYDATDHVLQRIDDFESLSKNLTHVKDLTKIGRQIAMKKVSPKMLHQCYVGLAVANDLDAAMACDHRMTDYLYVSGPVGSKCQALMAFLGSRIDFDIGCECESHQNFDVNFFKRGASTELDALARVFHESSAKLESIRAFLSQIIDKYEKRDRAPQGKGEGVKYHETDKGAAISLILTKRRSKMIMQHLGTTDQVVTLSFKSFSTDASGGQSDGLFEFRINKDTVELRTHNATTDTISVPLVKELVTDIAVSKVRVNACVNQVYGALVADLDQYASSLEEIIEFVTRFDVLYAKAAIARRFKYCKPVVRESAKSFVCAKNLRHCLIEQLHQDEIYVSNDVALGQDQLEDGVLLYGTNAVGKTSLIRALGVAVIMAQAGLYVPCQSFEFSPYQYLFTRILGNDDIHKGLSTFAVEMSELRTILRLANERSLILGDELCSGTESVSAKSIFVAGVQMLAQRDCSFIFATHLHEVASYDEIRALPRLSLKHMEVVYDKEKDVLIYDRKLKDGPGNSMYGLEVCKSLNLPQAFLDAAHDIRVKYQEGAGSVLSLKTSHFNSKKVVSHCEQCGIDMATEVHHLQHQKDADDDGFLVSDDGVPFHKNHAGNLLSLCTKCHDECHQKKTRVKKVKTSKGFALL
jgi:DNA mismatch repair protein MutS